MYLESCSKFLQRAAVGILFREANRGRLATALGGEIAGGPDAPTQNVASQASVGIVSVSPVPTPLAVKALTLLTRGSRVVCATYSVEERIGGGFAGRVHRVTVHGGRDEYLRSLIRDRDPKGLHSPWGGDDGTG